MLSKTLVIQQSTRSIIRKLLKYKYRERLSQVTRQKKQSLIGEMSDCSQKSIQKILNARRQQNKVHKILRKKCELRITGPASCPSGIKSIHKHFPICNNSCNRTPKSPSWGKKKDQVLDYLIQSINQRINQNIRNGESHNKRLAVMSTGAMQT